MGHLVWTPLLASAASNEKELHVKQDSGGEVVGDRVVDCRGGGSDVWGPVGAYRHHRQSSPQLETRASQRARASGLGPPPEPLEEGSSRHWNSDGSERLPSPASQGKVKGGDAIRKQRGNKPFGD
jgi:hypothetical protein